ncbi:peptidase [Candidatus Nitrosotenuis aquarius]|uniref:peptidase n=1 Tax=Candidatus Nitrosotenuis aquarius TaxID=1846278 RepID=UPI000C1F6E8A|nr:peptidase [Candidatus Nitrosotenuis aquarius]
MKIILGIVLMLVVSMTVADSAFGHGIGGENLPVSVGGRNATLFVGVQPSVFDPTNNESYLTVKLTDGKTEAVIEHVTFVMELTKDGKQIFKETFHDDLGNVNIKVISKDSGQLKIDGDKESASGGWTRKMFSSLAMEGPIFTSGGLYKFHIEIIGIDSDQNFLAEPPNLNGAISIAEKTSHSVTGIDQKKYAVGVTSYYDRINNFAFDTKNSMVSFDMPFDWSYQNINQTSVVHQEIHIPKTFAEMLVTKYDATLNDIPLKESSVTIDDYSEEARIVHLVINQKDLLEMTDKTNEHQMRFTVMPSKNVQFPLQATTGNAQFQVGLSWDPPVIYPGQNVDFYVDFNELFTDKKPKSTTYDFVLSQHGNEIFRKKSTGLTNSPTKTNTESYTFSSDDLGPIIVSIKQIGDNQYANADFVAVVKPIEKPPQTFPIRLSSTTNEPGTAEDGRYFVDLTWIPLDLTTQEESEFIITIYDQETLLPIPKAEYDFVVLQNNNEIFRHSGIAQAGGDFVNFRFSEPNVGQATLRIENIDKSSEYVEIPISVTPEFPLSLIVLAAVFSLIPLFSFVRNRLIA